MGPSWLAGPVERLTYARKTGRMEGLIILYAFTYFSNISSTASGLARFVSLLPCIVLYVLDYLVGWSVESQVKTFPKPFHQIV